MKFVIYDATAYAAGMALNGDGVAIGPRQIDNPAHADFGKWGEPVINEENDPEGLYVRWADLWATLPTYEGEPGDLFLPSTEVI